MVAVKYGTPSKGPDYLRIPGQHQEPGSVHSFHSFDYIQFKGSFEVLGSMGSAGTVYKTNINDLSLVADLTGHIKPRLWTQWSLFQPSHSLCKPSFSLSPNPNLFNPPSLHPPPFTSQTERLVACEGVGRRVGSG
jgi:hypothetical protein